ncbi:putative idc1 protein [Rosellinia necatrix]|uniref:Putative idc1 protein n=1 Tax=Rosellinia necatrix TaxID=77044 RepID=A0A1W2TK43_ROSNE|nr:putative idc1 protein [Rosellinia necatrix]
MSTSSYQPASHHYNASISSAGRSSRKGKATLEPREFASPSMPARYFEPTAATDQMLLYGQGTSVVVARHDSLTIERRFSRHSAEVQLLAVDTQSSTIGNGRFVVSYDAEMTAIVWDLMTGEEVARFASYEHLTCAAWMRNGNVAFGNVQGNVILFEPMTSEHLSARTIDQIPITALAPAADCRTFAIGYQNGSLIVASLQPRFTILHSLSTSRAPSPIVTLAWHASSSRQKSDMLAVQTDDGDLRVWSVAKSFNSNDPAKVVRILKRNDNYQNGPNWMGWSKNGRIIQFSDNETLSWDVRTKHVTWDSIPTLEHVRGLAVYGPGAILFTLGAGNTVQQFDLNTPAMMITNVQHPANLLPPSPPVSIEEQPEQGVVVIIGTESDSSIPVNADVSESDDDNMSPLARMVRGTDSVGDAAEQDRYMSASPGSTKSSTVSKSSTNSGTQGRYQPSIQSRGMTENTYISASSSSLRSSARPPFGDKDAYSISSVSSASVTSSSRSRNRPSRLRNEVLPSPDESRVHDLFRFTRSRLHDVPYKRTPLADQTRLTNDDLRRQMLNIIFGWNREMEDLVRDEMLRHPTRSASRILLAKWLGDIGADIMTTTSENMTSSDWMLLALSGMGGQPAQHSIGRAYVQRLLENGDIHAAVTIMIGMGDHNDAIEIYVSHKKFLEALVLLCLFFPSVWERQAAVIKKWGDFAVQHNQQGLAIRCFACTGIESSEPWTSPSATQVTFPAVNQSIPEILSPPLSPPGLNRGPQRSIAKTSALKLITSFDEKRQNLELFTAGDDGKTPIAAGVTPIAESAISPGGRDPSTAFLRPSQRSVFNTPASANPATPGGFGRQLLPSIGEVAAAAAAAEGHSRNAMQSPSVETAPDVSQARPKEHTRRVSNEQFNAGLSLTRASTASPMIRDSSSRKEAPPPSPSPESLQALMQQGRSSRNGARDRRPEGMELKLNSLDATMAGDVTSPEQSVASSARFHWPTRRRGPGSVASSVTSNSSAGRSYRMNYTTAANRGLNDYIHSLETAQHYSKKQRSRESSRHRQEERSGRSRENSRSRKAREGSEDRGRGAARNWTPKPAKRSPTSPVPMSPEELINLATSQQVDIQLNDESMVPINIDTTEPSTIRKSSQIRRLSPRGTRTSSRTSSRAGRHRSRERRPPALELRGRSGGRGDGSIVRSPSSPLPMSNQAKFYQMPSDDEADYQAAVEAQEQFRSRHNRSGSAKDPSSPAVTKTARDRSESRRRRNNNKTPAAEVEHPMPAQATVPVVTNTNTNTTTTTAAATITTPLVRSEQLTTQASAGDLKQISLERQFKKEAAARELEERRQSLARRPSAPPILHPDELSPVGVRSPSAFELPQTTFVPPRDLPPRSQTADYATAGRRGSNAMRGPNGHVIGLPATPKAMRLQFQNDGRGGGSGSKPSVPSVPANYQRTSPPSSGQGSPNKPGNGSPTKIPEDGLLTLLPSTVYSPPATRPNIPRCMSAPIPEEPVGPPSYPSFQHGLQQQQQQQPPRRGSASTRKMSVDSTAGMRGIDEIIGGRQQQQQQHHSRKSSRDDIPLPPPPPPPPILKELQHLAMPPPPPPAPIPGVLRPTVYGSPVGTGSIEIVMDEEEEEGVGASQQQQQQQGDAIAVVAAPMQESVVPIITPPSRNGHNRGRSNTDNSIAGRIISRATERMRSASRGRSNSILGGRTKSPEQTSPYESVPPPPPPPPAMGYNSPPPPPPAPVLQQQQQQQQMPFQMSQTVERHPREVRMAYQQQQEVGSGLHRSEMI